MSILGDLPEGVISAMFLRDGWPDAIVCKVLMSNDCIGIGIFRAATPADRLGPGDADQAAMADAISRVSAEPPDYTDVHEHLAAMKEKADAAAAATFDASHEEVDDDLQAKLGQPAR